MAFVIILIVILIVVFLLIYPDLELFVHTSDKETYCGKIVDALRMECLLAIGKLLDFFDVITAPKSRKIRKAREILLEKNTKLLYQRYSFKDEDGLKRSVYYLVDNDKIMKAALKTLGLSEKVWKEFATEFLYIHFLLRISKGFDIHSQKVDKSFREQFFLDQLDVSISNDSVALLIKVLNYFGISKEEWVENGDEVVKIYHLFDRVLKNEKYKEYMEYNIS